MDALNTMSVTELRDHVEADPVGVRAEAIRRQQLDPPDLADRARLQWAIGIAERELGHLDAAAGELRAGVDLADAAGATELAAGLKMTLAIVVGRLGDLDGALHLLDDATSALHGAERARATVNRGLVLYWRGDFGGAAATLETACRALKRHGDRTGEVRTRVTLGAVLGQIRDFRAAERHLREAIRVAGTLEQTLIVASAHHNLGYLGMLQRDLPRAIAEFEHAEAGYVAAQARGYLPQIHTNHAQVLADAGLLDDAEVLGRRALEMLTADGNEIEIAGALMTVAEIRLAQRDHAGARGAADDAAGWYRKQGRDGWMAISMSLALQAAARDDKPPSDVADQLDAVADRLDRDGLAAEASRSRLAAALVRAESGDAAIEDPVSADTRRRVRHGSAPDRILLAHVDALAAHRRDDRSAARRAISRGLAAAMASQAALGSIETRAHAAVHGNALAEIGARIAVSDGRPRELLARIEATRVMAARTPELRPPTDPELARLLAELRGHELTLADASVSGAARQEAERNHARLEREVRRRARTARGDASTRINIHREIDVGTGAARRSSAARPRPPRRSPARRFGGGRPGSTA